MPVSSKSREVCPKYFCVPYSLSEPYIYIYIYIYIYMCVCVCVCGCVCVSNCSNSFIKLSINIQQFQDRRTVTQQNNRSIQTPRAGGVSSKKNLKKSDQNSLVMSLNGARRLDKLVGCQPIVM